MAVGSTCSIDGCGTIVGPKSARGWCSKHYQRWLANGTPTSGEFCATCGIEFDRRSRHPGLRYCAGKCKPRCVVEGCDRPRRKREWCANHYTHWRSYGDAAAPYKHKWADGKRCVICGATGWPGRRRRFCSGACQQVYQRHGMERPESVDCALCGTSVDLGERGKAGRLKRADTLLCSRCRYRRGLRHKQSVGVIAARDGTECGICTEPVDMALTHPHALSASVDHIIPRARGGTDDLGNLQLAHLTCNLKKHTSTNAVGPAERGCA